MSRGGRVMGRGRSLQASLESTDQVADPMAELANMLQIMGANADIQEKLAMRDMASRATDDPTRMVEVANMLLQTCASDWHKVDQIGELCCYLAAQEPNGVTFRSALLLLLQNEHQQLGPGGLSEERALSLTALLCYLLVNMRSKDGSHFGPLAGPLADSIAFILNDRSSDEAVTCAADQIHKAREPLQRFANSASMSRLQNAIRQGLSNDRGSRSVRLQLLNDLEVLVMPPKPS